MKYDEIRGKVKKHDFVEIATEFDHTPRKCIVTSISKGIMKVAPILEDESASAVCPVIAMPLNIISEINKVGDHMLLFYSDLNNIHIEKAILSKNNNRRANAKI